MVPILLILIIESSLSQMTRHSGHDHFTIAPWVAKIERECVVLDKLVPGVSLHM